MSEQREQDVNDAFENLLMAEDLAAKSCYEDGYKVGKNNLLQGYHLGYHKASTVASQLGYYKGVLVRSQTESPPSKLELEKQNLLLSIRNFPTYNDSSIEIMKSFENVKFNFNKFCSKTKNNVTSFEGEKLNF